MCLFYHLFFLHLQRDHYKSMRYMRCIFDADAGLSRADKWLRR